MSGYMFGFFFVVVALNDFEWGAFNLKQRHAKF